MGCTQTLFHNDILSPYCCYGDDGFIFHAFSLSASCLPVCHCLTKYKKHQIVTKVWRETIRVPYSPSSLDQTQTLCRSLTFFNLSHVSHSLCLRFCLCLCTWLSLYPQQANVAVWPHSSTISVEQLVSIRSPFRSICACARIHSRTPKTVGRTAFFGSALRWTSNWITWPKY